MCETTTTYCDQRGCEADDGYGCTGHTTSLRCADCGTTSRTYHTSPDFGGMPMCVPCFNAREAKDRW